MHGGSVAHLSPTLLALAKFLLKAAAPLHTPSRSGESLFLVLYVRCPGDVHFRQSTACEMLSHYAFNSNFPDWEMEHRFMCIGPLGFFFYDLPVHLFCLVFVRFFFSIQFYLLIDLRLFMCSVY